MSASSLATPRDQSESYQYSPTAEQIFNMPVECRDYNPADYDTPQSSAIRAQALAAEGELQRQLIDKANRSQVCDHVWVKSCSNGHIWSYRCSRCGLGYTCDHCATHIYIDRMNKYIDDSRFFGLLTMFSVYIKCERESAAVRAATRKVLDAAKSTLPKRPILVRCNELVENGYLRVRLLQVNSQEGILDLIAALREFDAVMSCKAVNNRRDLGRQVTGDDVRDYEAALKDFFAPRLPKSIAERAELERIFTRYNSVRMLNRTKPDLPEDAPTLPDEESESDTPTTTLPEPTIEFAYRDQKGEITVYEKNPTTVVTPKVHQDHDTCPQCGLHARETIHCKSGVEAAMLILERRGPPN